VLGACRRKRHQNPINSLNFMRNGENRKTGKNCVVRRARPCVCMARAVCTLSLFWHGRACCQDFGFCIFLCFFTHLCFELTFGVNIKVLDNFIRFPMALVWLENNFWILSYDRKTPSRRILRKFSTTVLSQPKTYGLFPKFKTWVLGF